MLYALDPRATCLLLTLNPQPPPAYYRLYPQQQQPLRLPQEAVRQQLPHRLLQRLQSTQQRQEQTLLRPLFPKPLRLFLILLPPC